MKQYIDKAAVVAEIERRKHKLLDNIICERDKEWVVRTAHQLNRILLSLDTLEVKEVEEAPVNKDLEEAVENYAATGEVLPNGKIMINFQAEKAFRAGANWQKKHLIGKMEQFLYEELSNGDIECSDMKFLIKYFKSYMKEN